MNTATDTTELFTTADGRAFLLKDKYAHSGDWYYSPDGYEFFTLVGGAGTTRTYGEEFEAVYRFTEPRSGLSGELKRVNDVIAYDGVEFLREVFDLTDPKAQETLKFVGLPFSRKPSYLSQFPDGTLLYVSQDEYLFTYEGMKLFIGEQGVPLREVREVKVTRYRDGGTTFIYTEEGTFYSPTPFIDDMHTTWTPKSTPGSVPDAVIILEVLDPADYNIIETPDGQATIIKK